jgi:AraC-like DNA-binding protein
MFNLWSLHFYLYEADLKLDGVHVPIRPGCVSVIPPGVVMEFRFRGPSTHAFAHFTLRDQGDREQVMAMSHLPYDFTRLLESMYLAVRVFPESRLRAEVRVWDILLELAAHAAAGSSTVSRVHPAYARARELIELRLGQSLDLAGLAAEIGISHNQLTRIFRRETDTTIIGYVHERRARLARHLLQNTTLPMKAIGAQIGITNPNRFNKFIHRRLGMSPSAVRRQTRPTPRLHSTPGAD